MMQEAANPSSKSTSGGPVRGFCGASLLVAGLGVVSGCLTYPVPADQSVMETAEAATRRRDWPAAQDYWMRTIEEVGDIDPRVHLEAAKSSLEMGELEQAQAVLENGIILFPENARLRFMNGELLCRRGYRRAAEENFRIAVRSDPKHAEAWMQLAQVRLELDLPQGAYEAVSKYIELVGLDERAMFTLGRACAKRGELANAMSNFAMALENPDVGIDQLIDAATVVTNERYADTDGETMMLACSWVDRALDRDPQNSEASYVRGMILEKLGNDEGAIEAYERAVELTDHLLAMTRLAQAYARAGNYKRADDMIDRALDLNVHASHRRMLERVRDAWRR